MINKALEWEQRSGAIFKEDKTAFIYFIRNRSKTDNIPIKIKGELVALKQKAKILEVIFDPELRFRAHISEAGWRKIVAALALQRMRALPPSSAK